VRRRSRRLIGLAFLVLLLSSSAAQADASPIPIQQYTSRLDAALAAIGAVPVAQQNAAALNTALSPIGLPVAVSLPGGAVVTVTRDSLIGSATNFGVVTARIKAARDDAAGLTTAQDTARVSSALDTAYNGSKAQSPGLWTRLTTYIGQAISWLLYHSVGALFRSGLASIVATIALVLIVVVLLLFLRSAGRGVVPDARGLGSASIALLDWRAEAERALAAGDLHAAVRALYHVLLETLASRGVVDEAPGLTAGECRDAVRRARPGIYPDIERATLIFERVAYGDDPAEPDHVATLREAEKKVRAS
jgi:hypothetical protein